MIRKVVPYKCPECKKNLRGKMIPKNSQHLFGADHFGLELGIYSMEEDRTVGFECPFCKYRWKR